jgi:hypothetical protein
MDGSLDSRKRRTFWIAIGLGPACWFGALLASDTLQPLACQHLPWLLPGISAGFATILGLSLFAAVRAFIAVRNPHDGDHFIGLLGVMTPAIFGIALLWTVLATSLFRACQ